MELVTSPSVCAFKRRVEQSFPRWTPGGLFLYEVPGGKRAFGARNLQCVTGSTARFCSWFIGYGKNKNNHLQNWICGIW